MLSRGLFLKGYFGILAMKTFYLIPQSQMTSWIPFYVSASSMFLEEILASVGTMNIYGIY
jgi:hypothetical protein